MTIPSARLGLPTRDTRLVRSAPLKLLQIELSPVSTKKWRAVWSDGTKTDFGAAGYSDYTIHKDRQRRERYRMRHQNDHLDDPKSPGALSWYILWGPSTDMQRCIAAFRRRFGV